MPQPTDALSALASMRTSEAEMRARLRFLQVARLEGWDVATQFAKVKGGITDDPDLVEARKLAAKHKTEKDNSSTPSKFKKGNPGQSASSGRQWVKGQQQQTTQQQLPSLPQQAVFQQTAGYGVSGINPYSTPTFNLQATQPLFSQQANSQPLGWPGTFSQAPLQLPSQLISASPFFTQAAQPRFPPATATTRTPLVCFACNQQGHKVGAAECPKNKTT